ncbi:MAG: UDP-N-acetylenolpyruvoylglucosamine reductase, partial [Planctomycetota bacterium]|nr:UDP-N-acetylenolpyruvoylglucosamine reductase [Planctomycetota bacterium]
MQRRFEGGLEVEHPLAPLTTWRIGGPAELYLEPATPEELAESVGALWRIGMPLRVLGGGSNILVSDRGVR